jgi:hypothetical protein
MTDRIGSLHRYAFVLATGLLCASATMGPALAQEIASEQEIHALARDAPVRHP